MASLTTLDQAHQVIHMLENNPDDTMNLALTNKEFVFIVLGMYATDILWPCLSADPGVGSEFMTKVLEIAGVQKPGWVGGDFGVEGEDGEDPSS